MDDIVVLSDLHLGRGRNPETGRYHNLETFFFDDDFRRFCRHAVAEAVARDVKVKFVLNGDTFDLLRLEPEPAPAPSLREQRFGIDRTPDIAAMQVGQILAGHPIFVEALADVLASGHEIVMLPGNHDIELQWAPVQAVIQERVASVLASREAPQPESIRGLRFESWFLHEPGRIWIEHGCQYDPECAFRYPLRGALAKRLFDPKLLERDLPLGNFTQRYLYNAFGPITFIVPSTRANVRYVRWLVLHEPRLLLRVLVSHLPFIVQVIRRLSQVKAAGRRELQQVHAAELEALAVDSGLGETLRKIDALKNASAELAQTLERQGWVALRLALLASFTALASAGLWFTGFLAINELSVGFGPKSVLFIMLNLLMLMAATMGASVLLLRPAPDESVFHLREGARALVRLLDVPVVTFGHTHDEIIWRLDRPSGGKAWYYNTGTWIAVFTDDVLLPRERVQFTFLRMRGMEAELLHWSPGRGEALPVILLDELVNDSAVSPTAVDHV